MALSVRGLINKMFRGPRTAPEGGWQMAYGLGEFGTTFEIPTGDGFQRYLDGTPDSRNLIVAAIRNAYSMTLGGAGLDHTRRNRDGGVEILVDSPYAKVLRYPNPYQHQTEFVASIASGLCYYGNSYVWAKTRDARNVPTELIPLTPRYRRAVSYEGEVFYDVTENRDFFSRGDVDALVPARDVAHFKLATHRDLLLGESMITDAAYTMALNSQLTASSTKFVQNMARPSGIVSVDGTLTASQMNELREKFNEYGQGPHAGKTPIMGGGAKWQPMSITAVDAEIISLYNLTVVDLCRIFRIPIQLLGQPENGAASSVETLINTWRATGLLYFAETIERTFERLFQLPTNEEIRFDLNNIARANMKDQIDMLVKAVQGSVYSPNEARAEVGKPAVEYGEEPRLQAQVVPLSMASVPAAPAAPAAGEQTKPDPEDGDDDDDDDDEGGEEKKHLTDEEAEIVSYHRMKALIRSMEQSNV